MNSRLSLVLVFATVILTWTRPAQADLIVGGTAVIQFNSANLAALNDFGLTPVRFYGTGSQVDTATRAQILEGTGGGVVIPSAPTVSLIHDIVLSAGSYPTPRVRQATVIDIDPNTPLSTWATGEQIGLDGITLFNTISGQFVLGDYSLTYEQDVLSINNSFDVSAEAFRILAPSITTSANGFTLTGDLLTGNGLSFGFGIPLDSNVGTFTFNAVTAVPEPTSLTLGISVLCGLSIGRLRRKTLVRKT